MLVAASAKIGADCKLGPDVSIGEGCVIGDGVRLSNCVVMKGVEVGKHSKVRLAGWRGCFSACCLQCCRLRGAVLAVCGEACWRDRRNVAAGAGLYTAMLAPVAG